MNCCLMVPNHYLNQNWLGTVFDIHLNAEENLKDILAKLSLKNIFVKRSAYSRDNGRQ